MTVDAFLSRFDRKTKTGNQWLVQCPGHEDRKASLAVATGAGGRTLLTCHAGCDRARILTAMGLTDTDLFSEPIQPRVRPTIVNTYDYRDETGTQVLHQTVRYEPKDFRQRRPDGKGDWIWNLTGARLVLYRLDELQGKEVVAICAGEKDADAIVALGIPATTNPLGEGKWRPEYTQQLVAAGVKRVRIFPDNDDVGRAHADHVARGCIAAGILDVKVITLPDVPKKGDVSDYLATHSKDDLVALVRSTGLYTPASQPQDATADNVTTTAITFTSIGDLLAEPDEIVEWVVQERIPRGGVIALGGKPKAGKSTLCRNLGLEVAKGGRWLGFDCLAGPVWYVSFEDRKADVRRHMRQMGATGDEPLRFVFPQRVEDMLGKLHALAATEKPVLIIVDTMQRLVRITDLNDYAKVTLALTPVLELARETGAAVLLVHHAGKGERSGIDALLGSTAIAGSVDNVFVFARTDKYRLLSSTQRVGPDMPDTLVLLDEDTGRVRLGATRNDADIAELGDAIVAALADAPKPLEEKELSGMVEGKGSLKVRALRELVRAGRVQRDGTGRRGNPFLYSVSTSLVPGSIREGEKEKPKPPVSVGNDGTISHSSETALFGVRERESTAFRNNGGTSRERARF